MSDPIALLGFCPDLDPSTPGALIECVNIIPSERGLASAPTGIAPIGVGALSADLLVCGATSN